MARHTGKFWLDKSSFGRNPKYAEPEHLWQAALEYFDWVEQFPLWEAKLVSFQGASTIEKVPKMRAMTLGSCCLFMDISMERFFELSSDENFKTVCFAINQAIKEQKFGGAAADLLNASIIARDLGLADKRELSGPDGGPINTKNEVPAIDKMNGLLDKLGENAKR